MKKLLLVAAALLLVGCSPNNSDDIAADVKFYSQYKLDLYDDPEKSSKGEADMFFTRVNESSHPYGEKLLLSLVQENCSYCAEQYKYIEDFLKENEGFKYYAIFVDQEDDDGNYYFEAFFDRFPEFVKAVQSVMDNSSYASKSRVDMDFSKESISTPTNILFDFTASAPSYTTNYGVSEVCYSFDKDVKVSDMVNHSGLFA